MNEKTIYKAAPAQENKGKNLIFPLVFCVLALGFAALILLGPGALLRQASAASGAPSVTEIAGEQAASASEPSVVQSAFPKEGEAYGTLRISGTSVDCQLYYGDGDAELNAGAGTYMSTCLPGQGGTILIAGHTGTYFRDLESVQVGADITIQTNYGEYHYEVTGMQPALATDTSAYDLNATPENVILYTCYPFGQTTPTDWRYFVYGKLVSGPSLEELSHAQ